MVRSRRLLYSTDQGIDADIDSSIDIDMDMDTDDIDDKTEDLDEDVLEDDDIDIMDDRGEDHHHRHHDDEEEEESEGANDDHHQKDHFLDGILDHQMMAAKNDIGRLHSVSDSDADHSLLGHGDHRDHHHHHPMSRSGQQFGRSPHENMMTSTTTAAAFCKGMPMVMYMDGFQWALRHVSGSDHDGDSQHGCLTFYFPSWVLDTRRKFLVACIVVFCLGVWCEAVSRWRHNMTQHIKRASARIQRQQQQQQQQQSTSNRRRRQQQQQQQRRLTRLWYGQTFLHGISGLSVYLLMLATMTYSLEFLCAVVFGLMAGYLFFGGDSYKHAGSPCCTLFDNDDDEVTVATVTGNNNGRGSGGSSDGGGESVDDNVGGNIGRGASPLAFPPQSIFSENHSMDVRYFDRTGDCCSENRTDDESNGIQQPLLGKKSGADLESKENV